MCFLPFRLLLRKWQMNGFLSQRDNLSVAEKQVTIHLHLLQRSIPSMAAVFCRQGLTPSGVGKSVEAGRLLQTSYPPG